MRKITLAKIVLIISIGLLIANIWYLSYLGILSNLLLIIAMIISIKALNKQKNE
jgi:hypothetical protein